MAVRFSEQQVLKATGGVLRAPGARTSYEQVSTDSRALPPGCLFVALKGERFNAHQFLDQVAAAGGAGAIVQQGEALPAVPKGFALFEVKDTLAALGALGQAHRQAFKAPVGAVGGSNGKTTTKEMVGAILATRGPALKTEGNFNNEVGVPLTLLRLEPAHVAAVIEVGMNHPGELTRLARMVRPQAALITVIQPEHLEGLGSLEGVAEAEGELFRELDADAVAVVNVDDAFLPAQAARSAARRLTFGRSPEAQVRLAQVKALGKAGQDITVAYQGQEHRVRLAFLGAHNALNATGAFALALALGYAPAECVRGLEAARPYSRRLNVLEGVHGGLVVDDCYNANPASMGAALETLQSLVPSGGRAVAVLGDMLELGPGELEEHAALGRSAATQASVLAFLGPRSAEGQKAAGGAAASAHFTDVAQLLAWLSPQLRPEDVVLVKGSRGMRLERVVSALTGTAPAESGH